MAHNVSVNQNPNDPGGIGRLTIAATPVGQPHGATNTLRISRVRGGLRFHATDGPAHVHGEDLFALREFLAEIPEEQFVRPADPVEKPRFAEGDLIGGSSEQYGATALYRHNGYEFVEIPSRPGLNYALRALSNARAEALVDKGTLVVRFVGAR